LLQVPIGVVRVLTADLRDKGVVTITEPAESGSEADRAGYTELLEKVLDGIKAL
jgi:hypothetical protein